MDDSETIDTQRPWMLKIGDYCKITQGCMIFCHDHSRSVLRRRYHEIIGEGKPTFISNNVFLGVNTIVLMGTTIGNNVIVGAGSEVSASIPDDVVVAGNPAKIIRTLDEHRIIRERKTIEEAVCYFHAFEKKIWKDSYGRRDGTFFSLFIPPSIENLNKYGLFTKMNGDNEEELIEDWLKGKPCFSSYESFIEYCKKHGEGCIYNDGL